MNDVAGTEHKDPNEAQPHAREELAGPSVRAMLLRSFLPLIVGGILADALFSNLFSDIPALHPALSSAAIAVLFVILFSYAASRIAFSIGNNIDGARLKQAEAERTLQEKERDFRVLFSHNPNPMWVYDAVSLLFLEVNGAALAAYGYSREEFLGMRITDIRPEEDRDRVVEDASLPRPALQFSGEWRHKKKNGESILVEIVSHEIEFERRKAVLVAARDITSRKAAETALIESNARLEKALNDLRETQLQVTHHEKLRMLGTMASGIAHDFNNALSPILGYSDLLIQHPENLGNRDKTLHALEIISLAAQDAARVVSRMRQFYRQQERVESFHPLDLNLVVKESAVFTEPRWRSQALVSGITIRLVTELGEIPEITGSASEIREAVTNLIFNAVDAMPKGGTLSLRTWLSGSSVILEIGDTGNGMSEAVQADCFKPFFSTKGEKGTGLGLSMVADIVKRHDGSIKVKSAIGSGTTFTIRFPARKLKSKREPVAPLESSPRLLRILLVDDEAAVREILSEYLTSDGHRVETASNGKEALEKFNPSLFDLVAADRAMPEMGGEELAVILKKIAPDKPFILLTGSADIMNGEAVPPAGVDLVLGKPIALSAMRQALAVVLEKFVKVEVTDPDTD